MSDVYLGEFNFTEEETGEIVQPDDSKEIKWTWTHKTLSVAPLSFCCRQGHEEYEGLKEVRQQQVLTEWAGQLGYLAPEYYVDQETKTIVPSARVNAEQTENWLKPNGRHTITATTPEEI